MTKSLEMPFLLREVGAGVGVARVGRVYVGASDERRLRGYRTGTEVNWTSTIKTLEDLRDNGGGGRDARGALAT